MNDRGYKSMEIVRDETWPMEYHNIIVNWISIRT